MGFLGKRLVLYLKQTNNLEHMLIFCGHSELQREVKKWITVNVIGCENHNLPKGKIILGEQCHDYKKVHIKC